MNNETETPIFQSTEVSYSSATRQRSHQLPLNLPLLKKNQKTPLYLNSDIEKIRIMHFVVNFSFYGRETKFVAEQAVEPSSPQRRQASPPRPFYIFLQHPASFIMHLQPSPASKARVLQTESAFTTVILLLISFFCSSLGHLLRQPSAKKK